MRILASAVAMAASFSAACSAAIIYDEDVDGDLSSSLDLSSPTDLGTLPSGTSTILGSLSAGGAGLNGEDELDFVRLVLPGDANFNLSSTGRNTIFSLFAFDGQNFSLLGSSGVGSSGARNDAFANLGELDAGVYALAAAPESNIGSASYSIDIDVDDVVPDASEIPVPAAGLLFLGGLALLRRRNA